MKRAGVADHSTKKTKSPSAIAANRVSQRAGGCCRQCWGSHRKNSCRLVRENRATPLPAQPGRKNKARPVRSSNSAQRSFFFPAGGWKCSSVRCHCDFRVSISRRTFSLLRVARQGEFFSHRPSIPRAYGISHFANIRSCAGSIGAALPYL